MFRILPILAVIAAIIAPSQNAEAAERKLLMSGFKDIIIENDITVELITGKSPKAIVSGDKKDLSRVMLKRRGRVLVVQVRSALANARRRPSEQPLKLSIQNFDLENVTIMGNGRLETTGLSNSGEARILIQGSGELKVGTINARRLTTTIFGNGNIDLGAGNVDKGLIELQGNATVNAENVKFNELGITHQGNGETHANVKHSAKINNSGRGRITINGTANCFIQQAGSAVIDCPKYAD